MKKILITIALILLVHVCVKAQVGQNMGLIEVNENNTATLKFDHEIDFIVVGNNPEDALGFKYYEIFQDGKICVLRGNRVDCPETSITIKLSNGNVFYGKLKYGNDTKIFYSFNKPPEENVKSVEGRVIESVAETKADREMDRLKDLLKMREEYFVYGARVSGIEFMIANIMNDESNTYFNIIVNNKSGAEFLIDGILFKYVEGKRRGAKRNEAKIEERIMPKTIYGAEIVSAYTKESIGVIIPLFSVGNSGDLVINIREKNGTRNAVIKIEGKDMLKVKVFKN